MSGTEPVKPRCHLPWQQMVIDSSGVVAPCCYWGAVDATGGGTPLGDFNTQTIDEIWNGPAYQRLRAGMAAGDLTAAGCGGCQAIKQGMALAFESDPSCESETGPLSRYAENIAVLKREVGAGATYLQAKPTIVSYTPSHKCNIRCTHCYQDATRTAEISRARADADIENLAPYLVRLIAGGGEPFLLPIWRRFLKTFDLTINPYLTFSCSTNATILSPEVEAGLKRFRRLVINVSVDGTGSVYEKVRVGARWDAVRANVRRLGTIVASADAHNSALGLSMCVMKSDITDLPNFVRYCTDDGLAFALWPVTQLPPSESLRHFDNAALEVLGWADALDEAERLVHDLYLPEMARRRNAPGPDPSEHAFWRNAFRLLRDAIPFDLPRVAPTAREVALPEAFLRKLARSHDPHRVYVFQRDHPQMPFTHGAVADGTAHLMLPPGRYCVNFSRGPGEIPDYWDIVRFDVGAGSARPLSATYSALTPRRIKARLSRMGMPRWVSEPLAKIAGLG